MVRMLKLSEKPESGHGPEVIYFWKHLVREVLAYAGFDAGGACWSGNICCRHWPAGKTQWVAPGLGWWRRQGQSIA